MIRLSIADSLVALYETDDNVLILLGHRDNVAACRLWAAAQKLVIDEERVSRHYGLVEAETIYHMSETQTAMFLLRFKS